MPESWRRILPVPAAAALYGVLLGLGFTTFLLTFATWALAAACLAVGTPATGLAVGLAFGAGRAVPVAVLAPRMTDGAAAIAAATRRAARPARRGRRRRCSPPPSLLAAAPPAARAAADRRPRYDPSAAGGLLAYQPQAGNGVLLRDGVAATAARHPSRRRRRPRSPGSQDDTIVVADAATLAPRFTVPAPGADAVALSADLRRLARRTTRSYAVARATPAATSSRVRDGTRRPPDARRLATSPSTEPTRHRQPHPRPRPRRRAPPRLRTATGALLLAPTLDRGAACSTSAPPTAASSSSSAAASIFSTTPTARRDKGYEDGHHPHHQGYPTASARRCGSARPPG